MVITSFNSFYYFLHFLSPFIKKFFSRTTVLFISSFLATLGLHCCSQAFPSCSKQGLLFSCGGFSCCRAWAPDAQASVVAAPRLQSTGSVVAVHGLSCSVASGVFPNLASSPCPLHLAGRLFATGPQGKSYPLLKYRAKLYAGCRGSLS